MPLIDNTFFVGELGIPNSDDPSVAASLTLFTNRYEVELLRTWLGEDLYRDFVTALGQNKTTGVYANVNNGQAMDGVDAMWANLLNGVEYEGMDQRLHKWNGFVCLSDDGYPVKKSPIANYVFYKYMRDQALQRTGIGVINPTNESGVPASGSEMMSRAWNTMIDWGHQLIWYLDTYYAEPLYVNWQLQNRYRMLEKFRYINQFSI